MGNIYSAQTTMAPVGKIMDYNNTNPSKGVALYRVLASNNEFIGSGAVQTGFSESFAQVVYGGGPYSLLHPNASTEFVAQNFDAIA